MSNLFVVERNDATEVLPPDAAERQRALDVRRSWIVEAPAGSGKTGLLIQRYLKLLAEESVEQPGQVLAITFTNKAAAEIRERILAQIESAARGEPGGDSAFGRETKKLAEAVLEKDRRLRWGLLEDARRLNVKTIDSLCAMIAGLTPVLAAGGGAMSPVEDAFPLYQAAARRTMMMLGGTDPELHDALRMVLLHRDGNLAECERLLADMLALREQWGDLIPLHDFELNDRYLDETVLQKLESTLRQVICAELLRLREGVPRPFLEELAEVAARLAEIEPYGREISPLAPCAGMGVPGTDAEHLAQWRALIHLLVTPSSWTWRKAFAKNNMGFVTSRFQRERLKQLMEQVADRDDLLVAMRRVDRLPPAKYPAEQWRVAKALFKVLRRALIELRLIFAEQEQCDFAELALQARSALREQGGVVDLQEAMGTELRHLLVDEMQDTSTSQYELLGLLTQGWDGQSQTVFLVGDPKQSIYLFRQARVERFVRTMQEERLGDLPVGCLRLTANFRSQERLVQSFNEDFSLLFPVGASSDEVPYVSAQAVRGTGQSPTGTRWHSRVIEERRNSTEARRAKRQWLKEEAEAVRKIAKEWRERPLPPGRTEPWKIAVLVQSRRHLLTIVPAFKEGAIPFSAVNIDPLNECQEVLDLVGLTRALLHPADRVGWLAVLRAPWCGLTLADLHTIAGGDNAELADRCMSDLIEERMALLSADGGVRLERVAKIMAAAETQRGRLTTASWVERTWKSLGGDVSLNDAEMNNAAEYLRLLDELETKDGFVDLPLLQRRMEKLYAKATLAPGAIQLMTIHGAKGLEWDVVMVPGLGRSAGSSRSELLVWNEIEEGDGATAHGMLAPIAGKGEPSQQLNKWMKGLRDAREAAERKRLFYVACTRAREELHLFAAAERSVKGGLSPATNSLLKAAWPAAEGHFVPEPVLEDAGNVLAFDRTPYDERAQNEGIEIAASSEGTERLATLRRLPLSFYAVDGFGEGDGTAGARGGEMELKAHFERPEGSLAARSFGNAVHGFLELIAKRLKNGLSPDDLLLEVVEWGSRVETVLRSDGLAPAMVASETQRVLAVLRNSLADPEGRWLLGARDAADTEYRFTTWEDGRRSFRFDRVFTAGKEPLTAGDGCLWIIDYKTASHGGDIGLEEFLDEERRKYSPQLESYARAMLERAKGKELRVGLYYPALPRLLWWQPQIC